jgi:hypothetical protein
MPPGMRKGMCAHACVQASKHMRFGISFLWMIQDQRVEANDPAEARFQGVSKVISCWIVR